MKPIIGITPSSQTEVLDHGTFHRFCLSEQYVRSVAAAGGVPVILPPQSQAVPALVGAIHGLLLSGGPDVEPSRYGDESVHPATYGIDLARDALEIDLTQAALQRGTPIFGICRGIQVLNVALGGTLIQDVATEHPGSREVGHRQHERGLETSAVGHVVTATDSDSLPIFEIGSLGVNSFHHQAIRELAPPLAPVAYSPDGLIEAVVMSGNPSVFGVQWHPELMFERYPIHLRPFRRLVEAALAHMLLPAG